MLARAAISQGFVNLDFESANISGRSPGAVNVPIASAFPGWTAYVTDPSSNTGQFSQVWYDGISLGGPEVSINDSHSSIAPIAGQFSALLFGGGSSPIYSTTISQTGLVPAGTISLLFGAFGDPFKVALGGQTVNVVPLQTFSNYTLYGANISSFANQSETLSFTVLAPTNSPGPTGLLLDNIQFSAAVVPEPTPFALVALGGALLAWRNRRTLSMFKN